MVLNCSGRFFPNKYTVCLLYICGFPVCGTNHQELKFPSAIGWTWGCETCDYGETTAFIVLQHFMQEIWAPVDFSTCGGSGTIPKRWLCLIDQRMRILRGWKSWKLCLSQCISSVQCSRSVVSNFLRAHGLQHARLPCPSPTPRAYSNSCPLNRWCHPTISSSVVPFSSCLKSFPASGSFPVSQFFTSGGHSIGISVSASDLPMNIQGSFPLGWTSWISLQSKGLSRVCSNRPVQKHQFFSAQFSL